MRELCQCVNNHNIDTSIYDVIDSIKNAGFKNVFVQWYDINWEVSQQFQVDYCRKLGLNIIFAHLGYDGINNIWLQGEDGDKLIDKYIRNLDECKKNNIDLVIMHLVSKSVAPEPSQIGIKRLQVIVDYAEKLNIKIAFENTKIFGYLEYLFDNIKNENIGVCFDLGHCHCFYNNNFSWEKFKNRIFAVHLHDNDCSDDLHLLPFDGTADWEFFAKKLVEANYFGPVTLESHYDGSYLEMPLQDFYKLSYERAEEVKEIFENLE